MIDLKDLISSSIERFILRIYDREGLGFISNDTLRSLIGELLAPLSDEELDGIIEVSCH